MVQYELDTPPPALGEMDTTPLPVEMDPSFMPALSPSLPDLAHSNALLAQESGLVYLPVSPSELPVNGFATPMHLSMSDIPISAFINAPMEAMDPPQLHAAPDFMSDIRTVADPYAMSSSTEKLDLSPDSRTLSVSPPQSQVPSPSIHGTSSSYGTGVTSSLESALDPVTASGGRSRANTSLSPPSHPSPFPSLSPNLQNPEYSTPIAASSTDNLEESVSHQQPQTIIGRMLKDIAITAIDAGDAFENCHGAEQTTKVGELRDRIAQVLDMLEVMAFTDKDAPPYPPLAPPIPTLLPELPIPTLPIVAPPMEPLVAESTHLAVSDQSRKRCASELEEHRTVKALKREPQDDAPLTLNVTEVPIIPAAGVTFVPPQLPPVTYPVVQTPLSVAPTPRPPSRPPTPPSAFAANNSFGTIKQQNPITAAFTAFLPATSSSSVHSSLSLPMSGPAASLSFPPLPHSSWSDPVVPTRHHHSLSAGSISGPLPVLTASSPSTHSNSVFPPSALPPPLAQPPTVPSNGAASTISQPLGRMSRSGSISGTNFRNSYSSYPYNEPYSDPAMAVWHTTKNSGSSSRSGQSNWYMGPEPSRKSFSFSTNSAPHTTHNSPSDGEDEDEDSDSDESTSGKTAAHHTSGDRHSTSTASDLPAEYLFDVDRIFFEFLNKLCSNLEATDAKGEQIHQTLMAKKMQRLDESPDFRPFKFRIQAFTNAFMDELAKQGYPEEKIPMKKARNYLWRQQYILRFNEDGKKAKSKGNHIWNVEARKAGEGQWEFRPFQRRLAGTPPSVAYCGLRWAWKPHIWHPQCSFKKIPVTLSSPSLPPWLSWKNGELSGIPPPDAESCQVIAIAKFPFDNKDDQINHTFTISIAPVSALDTASYSRSRRPSLVGEPPKRSTSDSALFQIPQRMDARITRVDDTRVIRVLQNVAQRVTDKAESQFVSASPPKEGELQDLVKQKHVLEQTVHAYDKAISGQGHMDSRRLAVAAQHVVLQAAQTVIADRTVASGGVPTPQAETVAIQSVSVNELTNKTQDAIAMAVKMNGTASNEVDIIVTATSILKSQTPVMDSPTGTIPPPARVPPPGAPPSRIASAFPPSNLAPLPEYT
ncbi:hypothetical protein GALMADRAFT_227953 [Galerina marginata CBS 339.88]|uniref:Uncharacterized protein n=1 Tax=Galerina marginata (strain CBS 339.88) TaxID=685588 RepID=A0A067STZ4_GALM3|nr:hypothetical protein GALMADRAFT_227953 [Galerina marginata CBS 339.88]